MVLFTLVPTSACGGRPAAVPPAASIGDLPALPVDAALDDHKAVMLQRSSAMAAMMSDTQLLGQVLMVGLPDIAGLSRQSRLQLEQLTPGAILLFRYNLPSGTAAVHDYSRSLSAAAGQLPAFLAIDHEGGSVFRFGDEVSSLPAARTLGAAPRASALARLTGDIAGKELRALGFSMNLAPVVEAASGPAARFLSSRAWSADPYLSAALSSDYILAIQAAGLPAVAKHFPGTADVDPHYGLARLRAPAAELESDYLQIFSRVFDTEPAAVILSHIIVDALDPATPAPFSAFVVTETLKKRLGFSGIVMSDDMVMKAVAASGSMGERALLALRAGVDMVMVSSLADAQQVRDSLLEALRYGQLSRQRLLDAVQRILFQKLRFGLLEGSQRFPAPAIGEAYDTMRAGHQASLQGLLSP